MQSTKAIKATNATKAESVENEELRCRKIESHIEEESLGRAQRIFVKLKACHFKCIDLGLQALLLDEHRLHTPLEVQHRYKGKRIENSDVTRLVNPSNRIWHARSIVGKQEEESK